MCKYKPVIHFSIQLNLICWLNTFKFSEQIYRNINPNINKHAWLNVLNMPPFTPVAHSLFGKDRSSFGDERIPQQQFCTRASYNGISRWSIFLSYINYRPISPSSSKGQTYTQRNLFGILLNQTKIRLYLPYTDTFGTKRTYVWFQINQCIVNTIWFRFDLIRFRKDFKCTNMGIFFKERNSTLYPA